MDRCPICGEILEANDLLENIKKHGGLMLVLICPRCGYYECEIVNKPLMEEIDNAKTGIFDVSVARG